jgi:amino acid transporter
VGGWLLIGAYASSLAFYVTASETLLSQLFPSLETIPLYSIAGTEVYLPMLLVGAALAILVCVVNCYGTGLGAGTQLVFFCLMLAIGAVLVVVGFAAGSPSNFWPPYEPGSDAAFYTLRFVLPAMTFLTGFSLVAILAEDANLRPADIGKVVVAAVVIAGSFYCAVLLASAWIIPWEKTATLDQGTIDTYRVAGFPALGWGAYTISVLGLVTSFLALFVAASRIMVDLARAGLFPRVRQGQWAARHAGQRAVVHAGALSRARTARGGRAHVVSGYRGSLRWARLVYRRREHVLDQAPLPARRESLSRAYYFFAGDRWCGGRSLHRAHAGSRNGHLARMAV